MRIYALLARTSLAITVAATVLLGGCATIDSSQGAAALDSGAKWVLLPILNHTDVPQAGLRAEAITEPLLRAHRPPRATLSLLTDCARAAGLWVVARRVHHLVIQAPYSQARFCGGARNS